MVHAHRPQLLTSTHLHSQQQLTSRVGNPLKPCKLRGELGNLDGHPDGPAVQMPYEA